LGGMFRGRTRGALPLLRFPDADADRQARFVARLARAAGELGFPDEAETYAAAAWERARNAETAAARAVILAAAGRSGEAAAARGDAERGWPGDEGVRRMLLDAAIEAGDPAAIRAHAEAILAIEPRDAPARYELAKLLAAGGEERAALATLRPLAPLLAALPPTSGAAPEGTARLLGLLLAGTGRVAEAEPVLRAHLAAHPGDN